MAWRTVNEHLQVIFPEWDVAQTFPESSSWRVDVLYGCSTGSNSLVDGPPWSVRNENDVDHLSDPILRAQVDRGFDTLVERGFEPVDVGSRKAPEERSVRNDAAFGVVLMVSWRGSDMWTVHSSSPCITFPGNEEYSQTR